MATATCYSFQWVFSQFLSKWFSEQRVSLSLFAFQIYSLLIDLHARSRSRTFVLKPMKKLTQSIRVCIVRLILLSCYKFCNFSSAENRSMRNELIDLILNHLFIVNFVLIKFFFSRSNRVWSFIFLVFLNSNWINR